MFVVWATDVHGRKIVVRKAVTKLEYEEMKVFRRTLLYESTDFSEDSIDLKQFQVQGDNEGAA